MIVRSKKPLLYNALESRKGIISPKIKSIKKDLEANTYEVSIIDRLQNYSSNAEPGKSLYKYEYLAERSKIYPVAVINNLFKNFGQIINPNDEDFDVKFNAVFAPALLYISCTTSIYGSEIVTPEEFAQGLGAFELVEEEIVPEPV